MNKFILDDEETIQLLTAFFHEALRFINVPEENYPEIKANDQFLNLQAEKQNRIIQVAIKEFAQNAYVSASTNRIVKECGISKGSLFKYFTDKEVNNSARI